MKAIENVLVCLNEQHHTWFVVIYMTLLITLIGLTLKLLKIPIKHFTAKIKNERVRKLINKSIIILSFAIAISVWFLLNHFFPEYFAIDWVQIVLSGALPVVVYAIFDGVLTTDKVRTVVDKIMEAVSDGDISDEDLKKIGKSLAEAFDDTEKTKEITDETVKSPDDEEPKTEEENLSRKEKKAKNKAETAKPETAKDELKKLLGE